MRTDYLSVLVSEKDMEERYGYDTHVTFGLGWFIERYPEVLFRLNTALAARIVDLERGRFDHRENWFDRIRDLDAARTNSSGDAIIEHLGSLNVHRENQEYWFKPKRKHAAVITGTHVGEIEWASSCVIFGGTISGFKMMFDYDETINQGYYYNRTFRVKSPSPLPHVSKKPENKVRDAEPNFLYDANTA